ncbi:MAG: hypothetical protein J6Y10_05180 [Lachnospiraceae bacterium]|nr:hypothetical protein [Lachnospiraceae bacterium]
MELKEMLSRREQLKAASRKMQQMTMVHCNSCGAELGVTSTEASMHCPFCDQAMIVVERLEGCLRPDCIIPFSITKEQAEEKLREELDGAPFVPLGLQKFTTESLHGVYIPHWLYDVYYGDRMVWSHAKRRSVEYSIREGSILFERVTADGLDNLEDSYTRRLEPYDYSALRPFDAAYLSGFYSDCFNTSDAELKPKVLDRAEEMFDKELRHSHRKAIGNCVASKPVKRVLNAEYAMLPAWFLVFRYKGTSYTMLVNGQTGKVVGSLPVVKWKAYTLLAFLTALFTTIPVAAGIWLCKHAFRDPGKQSWHTNFSTFFDTTMDFILLSLMLIAIIGISWLIAVEGPKKNRNALRERIRLTQSENILRFTKERQGKKDDPVSR